MAINILAYQQLKAMLAARDITLVAVSKTKPIEDILEIYHLGHRDFGENYVQELVDKHEQLPKDIHWHFIGHLQTNKVKFIAPFVQLIHGVDSLKLLKEINKEAAKNKRVIDCLLQIHIAKEETKFGLDEKELELLIKEIMQSGFENINICGLMGMASFTDDMEIVRNEFSYLNNIFKKLIKDQKSNINPSILSMGMSSDFKVAVEEGSTMVRIGSILFGERKKTDAD